MDNEYNVHNNNICFLVFMYKKIVIKKCKWIKMINCRDNQKKIRLVKIIQSIYEKQGELDKKIVKKIMHTHYTRIIFADKRVL